MDTSNEVDKQKLQSYVNLNTSSEVSEKGEQKENITINNKVKMTIFITMVLISTLTNLDGGIIPRSTEQIIKDLHIGETELGYYGSIDYLGRMLGSLIFVVIINKTNRLYILSGTLILKGITLIIPFFFDVKFAPLYIIIMACRCISGFSQVYYTIYLPVWCDQYGTKSQNTIMIMFIQIGLPVGIVLGYGLAMLFNGQWQLCFLIQSLICFGLALFIFSFPLVYFSKDLILVEGSENELHVNPNMKQESSILSNLKEILSEMVFLFTGLSNSVVFFGMAVVQYWVDSYMENVLHADSGERFIIFASVCVTSPPFGMLLGGLLGNYVGGYQNKKAIVLCAMFSILSCVFALLVGLFNNIIMFAVLMWLYFFLICGMTPLETGIIIDALPERLRGDGFSVMNFFLNILGNLPAASAYGIIYEKTKKTNPRMAMIITMSYNLVGFIFVMLGMVFRFKKKSANANKEQEKKVVEEQHEE